MERIDDQRSAGAGAAEFAANISGLEDLPQVGPGTQREHVDGVDVPVGAAHTGHSTHARTRAHRSIECNLMEWC